MNKRRKKCCFSCFFDFYASNQNFKLAIFFSWCKISIILIQLDLFRDEQAGAEISGTWQKGVMVYEAD